MLHKDIKPDNFRIQDGQVKMIDFGLVTEFSDNQGNHYKQSAIPFAGTPLTGSINALRGQNHSRRDDLESLAYTFMFVINQRIIDWRYETNIESIIDIMESFVNTQTCLIPAEFKQIHTFIREV